MTEEKSTKFDILKHFQSDAAEIIAAREKARLIHGMHDIDGAGAEIEYAVREVFARRLPAKYHVGYGKIIDSNLKFSRKFDIVITDKLECAPLSQGREGFEYFPYESVYAVGEIKSAYYKGKNYFGYFSDSINQLQTEFTREISTAYHLTSGLKSNLYIPKQPTLPDDCHNPLFKFILFVDVGQYEESEFKNYAPNYDISLLPNVICILNKSNIMYWQIKTPDDPNTPIEVEKAFIYPEYASTAAGYENRWSEVFLGSEEQRIGHNLADLYLSLMTHLNLCQLTRPNYPRYMEHLLTIQGGKSYGIEPN